MARNVYLKSGRVGMVGALRGRLSVAAAMQRRPSFSDPSEADLFGAFVETPVPFVEID